MSARSPSETDKAGSAAMSVFERYLTLFVNWAAKPFSMALLGWIFVRHVFAPYLPADQIDSYIAGLILLAAAPYGLPPFPRALLADYPSWCSTNANAETSPFIDRGA